MKLKSEFISKTASDRLYQVDIPVVGLTGGIGSGKSTVAKLLVDRGFALIDADQLVKEVYAQPETVKFINDNFNEAIDKETQQIDFKSLRKIVFAHKVAQQKIEQFIYARLPQVFTQKRASFKSPEVIIYDVPLLFEKDLAAKFDFNVCVFAKEELQIDRVKTRDGSDEQTIQNILKAQLPMEEKKNLADSVIENKKGLIELEASVDNWINQYFSS
jgi:dephospho-CoA kinase